MKCSIILAFFVILAYSGIAYASPVCPESTYTFSCKGKMIILKKWGDEFLHGYETLQGYTVLYNDARNQWFFADRNDRGELYPTSLIVSVDDPAEHNIKKHLRSDIDPSIRMIISERNDITRKTFNHLEAEDKVTGIFFFPVILVDFPDQPGSFDADAFTKQFFTRNPDNPRSVVDYYDEVSYGKFQMKCDVFGLRYAQIKSPGYIAVSPCSSIQ